MATGPGGSPAHQLRREQMDFYEADAAAYDGWIASLADERNATAVARAARAHARALAEWLARNAPLGDVLEIAAGTGRVSQLLALHAERLLLIDSSATSLALAERKLKGHRPYVGGVCADLFEWTPPRRFDTVVFAAWLHHVPEADFDRFWALVDEWTAPNGRVMFDVALHRHDARAVVPPRTPSTGFAAYHDPARAVSIRDLDGRRWTVVHQTWETAELARRLALLGWDLDASGPVDETFRWATASRRR